MDPNVPLQSIETGTWPKDIPKYPNPIDFLFMATEEGNRRKPGDANAPTRSLILLHTEHFNRDVGAYEQTADDRPILELFQGNSSKVNRWRIVLLKPKALPTQIPAGNPPPLHSRDSALSCKSFAYRHKV